MPHHRGYRMGTRHMFSRGFRKHGNIGLKTYLQQYKIGDFVDIKVNAAQHKGMAHKFYHGRTGRVFNVDKRGVGVIVNKLVRNRILRKKISVRIEHIKPSKCRDEFVNRVKENARITSAAKARGEKAHPKRQPAGPREGFTVKTDIAEVEDIAPLAYENLF
ncbi:ribosomal protein L21 [Thecamonas trahens ATCC 50062]|uniref:Ribosomal protein L21 n=1 Tax=Thecamonas trahens ATCC 50062 TaxID=461836 RepID=A0A0L0DQ55_THETB|nr:ribosomal protein L21 [Thecamonas trahens ATCC 50062]KNC54400.1 ribosomal protein L21 [Thecamonas trahens ATCC 50062]|eukprot:XP_013753698.1 ribosomal protein L21 [Thecamonas trahens ATCC 50062]